MAFLQENRKLYNSNPLTEQMISALDNTERLKILQQLGDKPDYPASIGKKLGLEKQKVYYHFSKLEESKLIEQVEKRELSGGVATIYRPSSEAYHFISGEGRKHSSGLEDVKTRNFLNPLVKNNVLEGSIVVGSPDQHGPDQVRARDGHLAGEIGLELGRHVNTESPKISLDTELVREDDFGKNLLLVGGILTNTVTKKFNSEFKVSFSGEEFPYQRMEINGERYEQPEIGVIQKAENPVENGKKLFMVAGIRNRGTRAAVLGFKDLESIITDIGMKEYYIVRGLDMDGDGKIDSYEVVE